MERHEEDPSKSAYDNYIDLKTHHDNETEFLVAEVRKLISKLDDSEVAPY